MTETYPMMLNRRMMLGATAGLLASPAILRAQTSPRDLAATMAEDPTLARFGNLAQRAGFGDRLKGTQPLTVFVPTAAAFDLVPSSLMEDLLSGTGSQGGSTDQVRLAALVGIHIVEGTHTVQMMKDRVQDVRSLNGGLVRLDGRAVPPTISLPVPEGGPRSNNQTGVGGYNVQPPAKLIRTNILASNGMLHVIDGVLLP